MKDFKYFVWRANDDEPYFALGTRNNYKPKDDDSRCIWRGDSYPEATRRMVEENKRIREKRMAQTKSNQIQAAAEAERKRLEAVPTPLFPICQAGKP